MEILAYLLIGLAIGVVIGRFLLRNLLKQQETAAQNKAKKILKDAENNAEILKKNKLFQKNHLKKNFPRLKLKKSRNLNLPNKRKFHNMSRLKLLLRLTLRKSHFQ